ncbi:MAG: hypothetical protein HDT38_01325 [Clostridiales bacterium]|nr:hypothetical protein [Clostridiales bacterium]
MVGQLVCIRAKGRGRMERTALGPLAALRWTVYAPEGLAPWRLGRRLRKAERALARAGAGRVILGPDFPWGDRLALLRPVDPLPMLRACADVLALGALGLEGIDARRGRVALSAPRLCPELEGAAERLCPRVRGLVIDAPGGEDYARYLQARFGLPVSPLAAGADVTAAFGPGGGRWGRSVELYEGGSLDGLALEAEGIDLPSDCGQQVLAVLWERGEARRDGLRVRLIDKRTPGE